MPYVLVMIASLGAIAWAIRTAAFGAPSPSMQLALALTALWAIYNAGLVALALHAVLRRSHRRTAYRFDRRVPVDVRVVGNAETWRRTETGDLNPDGLSFFSDEELPLGQQVQVRLRFNSGPTINGTAVVMNSRANEGEQRRIGARFVEIAEQDRNHLTLALFGGSASRGGDAIPEAA